MSTIQIGAELIAKKCWGGTVSMMVLVSPSASMNFSSVRPSVGTSAGSFTVAAMTGFGGVGVMNVRRCGGT